MADFCRQCSEKMWGEDHRELAFHDWQKPRKLEIDEGYPCICEGCGFVRVNGDGVCLGLDDCICKEDHREYYLSITVPDGPAQVGR